MTNKILSIIPNLSYGDFVELVIINKKLIVANYVRTEQHTHNTTGFRRYMLCCCNDIIKHNSV